jgi:hypothetical protein
MRVYPIRCQTVFQCDFNKCDLCLDEIDDLLESTKTMTRRDKSDTFHACGVNYDNVEKYYEIVTNLEKMTRPTMQTYTYDVIGEAFKLLKLLCRQ